MSEEPVPSGDAPPDGGAGGPTEGPPPTSFQILCGSLAAQVQMSLGLLPGPEGEPPAVELDAARQGIDLLAMLAEKTQGNLDERESRTLKDLLTYLRMLYVHKAKEP